MSKLILSPQKSTKNICSLGKACKHFPREGSMQLGAFITKAHAATFQVLALAAV
jgi:hypothetical protein